MFEHGACYLPELKDGPLLGCSGTHAMTLMFFFLLEKYIRPLLGFQSLSFDRGLKFYYILAHPIACANHFHYSFLPSFLNPLI